MHQAPLRRAGVVMNFGQADVSLLSSAPKFPPTPKKNRCMENLGQGDLCTAGPTLGKLLEGEHLSFLKRAMGGTVVCCLVKACEVAPLLAVCVCVPPLPLPSC